MLNLRLEWKVALVTGAGQGKGRRIAIDLAVLGCKLGVNDLFAERAKAVAEGIGQDAIALPADICVPAAVTDVFRTLRERFAAVDILANNPGVLPASHEAGEQRPLFAGSSVQDQAAVVTLSVHGTMYCRRQALLVRPARWHGQLHRPGRFAARGCQLRSTRSRAGAGTRRTAVTDSVVQALSDACANGIA